MLISPRQKRPENAPKQKPLLLELSLDQAGELAVSGKPEEIRSFVLEGSLKTDISAPQSVPLPDELQSGLANRFYQSVRRRAVLGLLAPLSLPVIGTALIRPLNELLELGMNSYQMAWMFGCLILATSIWGSRRSIAIENGFSSMAHEILESGRSTNPHAQATYAEIIWLGRNTDAARSLLISGKAGARAQDLLAETIYHHGTKEHARQVLDSGYSGPGAFLLESMCRD